MSQQQHHTPKTGYSQLLWLGLTSVTLAGLSVLFYGDVISWFPSHIHAWTQSDRLALALCYLDNGFDFFHPCTFNLQTSGGIVGMDLPIHEYIIAILMWATGARDPMTFRLYTLLYSFFGYYCLFRLTQRATGSGMHACYVVVFAFTIPVITYYQAGFIPSAMSLSSVYAGLYFFFSYLANQRPRSLYWSVAFLCIATIPRLSVFIVLASVIVHLCMLAWRRRNMPQHERIAIAASAGILGMAVIYKQYLISTYGGGFLNTTMMADDPARFFTLISEIVDRWKWQFMTRYHYMAMAVSVAIIVYRIVRNRLQRPEKQLLVTAGLLAIGSILFFILFEVQFVHHEYYFMDVIFPMCVVVLITALSGISISGYLTNWIWPALLLALALGSVHESMQIQDEKYAETLWDRGEVTRKNFLGSASFLDRLGISRDAKVWVPEAYSTNAPLLLLERKGYASLNSRPDHVASMLAKDVDIIVVQDIYLASDLLASAPEFLRHVKRLGGNGRISVFEKSATGEDLYSAHGIDTLQSLNSTVRFERDEDDTFWSNIVVARDSLDPSFPHGALSAATEFGPTFSMQYTPELYNTALLEFDISGVDGQNFTLEVIGAVEANDESKLFYQFVPVDVPGSGEWQSIRCLFPVPREIPGGHTFKCYLWNRHRGNALIDNLRLTQYRRPLD